MGVRLTVASEGSLERASSPELLEPGALAGRALEPATWEFAQARIVLGRSTSSDVVLPHASVSARHATIEAEGVGYTIIDHGSTNGTYVNGARVVTERKKPLRDGDLLDLGLFRVTFAANVPVKDIPSRERTSALARRLLRAARAGGEPVIAPRLTTTNGPDAGRVSELPAAPARVVLGRFEECDVVLADGDASREHAELVIDADGVLLRDLASKNGVFVQERRVTEKRLRDRDELRIGATVLVFEDAAEPALRVLESMPDEPAPPPRPTAPEVAVAPPSSEAAASELPDEDLPPREPTPSRAPPAGAAIAPGEWAVYALALVVFLASAAGLVWLLRGP